MILNRFNIHKRLQEFKNNENEEFYSWRRRTSSKEGRFGRMEERKNWVFPIYYLLFTTYCLVYLKYNDDEKEMKILPI